MKLAAVAALLGGCGIALVASAGCGDARSGSPGMASSTLLPTDGVYSIQLEAATQLRWDSRYPRRFEAGIDGFPGQ
jgi:hypothetical protein